MIVGAGLVPARSLLDIHMSNIWPVEQTLARRIQFDVLECLSEIGFIAYDVVKKLALPQLTFGSVAPIFSC